jgi:hypothetical protein
MLNPITKIVKNKLIVRKPGGRAGDTTTQTVAPALKTKPHVAFSFFACGLKAAVTITKLMMYMDMQTRHTSRST